MLTTKEYYFQNENHEPSRYLGTREQISRRLREEHPYHSPSIITKHEAALRINVPSMRFVLVEYMCCASSSCHTLTNLFLVKICCGISLVESSTAHFRFSCRI